MIGLLGALAVAHTATRVSAIALPWFVLVTTGSAAQTGLVAFAEMTPYVLVKAFSGPLADRIGPRTVSWVTDLVSAVTAAAIPLLYALDQLTFPLLLLLVALIGAARGPGDLAKHVMTPEAAERGEVALERATGLAGVTERLASTVGPAAGGALIALIGPVPVVLGIAGCFALGSVIIALVLPRAMGRRGPARPEPGGGADADAGAGEPGYWRRFGEGFAFLRRDPLLFTVITMVGFINFLDAALNSLLLPVWAKESGHGPAGLGIAASAMGIAGVAGSLIAAAVAHRMRRRPVFFAGFVLAGAPRFLVLAVDAPLWVVAAVFAVSGFGAGFLNPILGAVSFERVPRPLLGRVSALGDSMAWSGIPFGGLLAGAAVTAFGLAPVLVAGGALYFLTTNLTGLRPEWREMDRQRAAGRTAGTAPVSSEEPRPPAEAGAAAGATTTDGPATDGPAPGDRPPERI
ncbi:MFS transporter permease [Streptomyces oceani]|uniref:MFS transporter permease n=1 Tax=Streptomyces oceani TaxID=1075402 RepID=A0A1E7JXF8_9ACTN|nr:MFS transporter permease [Streptomyces oceani]